jgi:hypothetical protein
MAQNLLHLGFINPMIPHMRPIGAWVKVVSNLHTPLYHFPARTLTADLTTKLSRALTGTMFTHVSVEPNRRLLQLVMCSYFLVHLTHWKCLSLLYQDWLCEIAYIACDIANPLGKSRKWERIYQCL